MQFVVKPVFDNRDRVFNVDELSLIMGDIRKSGKPVSKAVRIALELCALTLQRSGEVSGMKVDELNFERREWRIPAWRTKNRKEQMLPLSSTAFLLIEEALSIRVESKKTDNAVFPSPTKAEESITGHALTVSFKRLRAEHDWPKNIRLHDLRRTGASSMAELEVPESIITRVLNQTDANAAVVTAVYNRHNYMPQKREALETWDNRYLEIIGVNASDG